MSNVLVSGNISKFASLAQFNTREEMDLAIRSFLYMNKHKLTKSEQQLVKLCSQLAFKLKGVIFTKHEYLANKIGVSKKTVQRALKKLSELTFIKKHETVRKDGGKGHNVYVIQSIETIDFDNLKGNKESNKNNVQSDVQSEMSSREDAENPVETRDKSTKNYSDSLFADSKSSKRNKTIVHEVKGESIDLSFLVAHYIPKEFITYAKLVFSTAQDINTAWHILQKILKPMSGYSFEEKLNLSIKSIGSLFTSMKRKNKDGSKPIEKPFGYLKGICNKLLDADYENLLKEMSSEF
ncbi:hypothetical protein [Bacillus safensis]|uniref:hypothetical protein n=1 Tax=Bacillus safensis TaxID=561879 RepID=UPI00366C0A33